MKNNSEKSDATFNKGIHKIYKVIVIGDPNVGKTCLTYRFCVGKFPSSTEATIGVDFRERMLKLDEENIRLQLWDTAGQERFRNSMVAHYYRNAHAVVFVFDITNRESFEHLPVWLEECKTHLPLVSGNILRIMVANKIDRSQHRTVPESEAQKFADEHRMPLFETSAKQDSFTDHVEGIFMTLVHRLHASKSLDLPPEESAVDLNTRSSHISSNSSNSCTC